MFIIIQPFNYRIDSASRVIKASSKDIYQSFINPDTFALWLPPQGMSAKIETFDVCEGGVYKMSLTYKVTDSQKGKTSRDTDVFQGTFLKVVKDTKIVMSVVFDSEDPAFSSEMIQTWYLETVSEGTRVTLICENVPNGIRKEDHDIGLNSTLENLARFVER
ncbi:MAG: SRPBCC domain-containing protein [Planococcus donghaensis]